MNYIEKVHRIVQKIPKGKVTTYGNISLSLSTSLRGKITSRMVGWALSQNKDPNKVPCHRVVSKDGSISGYKFGGPDVKRRRLEEEKVPFKDEAHVNLEKCLWLPQP